MAETEKIEIMNFDQDGYLEDGRNLVETGKLMRDLADKVADEGYDAVFLMGVGGTWDELMQLEYLMNKFGDRDLEVYLIHAAEWNVSGHKRMTFNSVVLTASESGTTPEALAAELEAGHPIICNMAPGIFTKVGHYIAIEGLDDKGKALVHDSNSRARSLWHWDLSIICEQARAIWSFSVA